MTKGKYHDIDELLDKEVVAQAPTRRKRLSPALGAMTGDQKPMRYVDTLKQERDEAKAALEAAKAQFEADRARWSDGKDLSSAPIKLTMPVTKQVVTFELMQLDPTLIDVSPENERIQSLLDEVSLSDILPSIRKHGQQKPGTVRRLPSGRFELIEGSRRLACVKITGDQYLALCGEVPDADVRELSIIENQHQDVSPYEKAKAYQRSIENGEYESWTQLGASRGISSSHINRYKQCVELDEIFVRILPSPSAMPLSYGETISGLVKKNRDGLFAEAERLIVERQNSIKLGTAFFETDDIIRTLKSAVRTRTSQPTVKRPVVYVSKDKGVTLKHTVTNRGNTKFELVGLDDEQVMSVVDQLQKTFQLKRKG